MKHIIRGMDIKSVRYSSFQDVELLCCAISSQLAECSALASDFFIFSFMEAFEAVYQSKILKIVPFTFSKKQFPNKHLSSLCSFWKLQNMNYLGYLDQKWRHLRKSLNLRFLKISILNVRTVKIEGGCPEKPLFFQKIKKLKTMLCLW